MQRMTKQRIAVLRSLEEDDTFRSAQQVHQALLEAGDADRALVDTLQKVATGDL